MRATLALIGFVSALVLSPWVPILCIVLLSVRYRAWETLAIGALIDYTWWLSFATPMQSLPLCTGIAILLVWGLEPLRRQFLLAQ